VVFVSINFNVVANLCIPFTHWIEECIAQERGGNHHQPFLLVLEQPGRIPDIFAYLLGWENIESKRALIMGNGTNRGRNDQKITVNFLFCFFSARHWGLLFFEPHSVPRGPECFSPDQEFSVFTGARVGRTVWRRSLTEASRSVAAPLLGETRERRER